MVKQKFYTLKELRVLAYELREDLIRMLLEAGSGHSAGPLGLAEIFTAFYFRILKHHPEKPLWKQRDRLYLSCGHNAPIRYAAMIRAGYLPKSHLKTLRKFGTKLQGHPSYHDWPAMEHASGPLGQGSSVALGAAIAAKMDNKKHWVYCVVSDGEQQEGQTWEAAMMAGNLKLGNLIFLMDRNYIQIDGNTEDVMPLEPLKEKYEAFGWHVLEIDGHNMEQIIDAVNEAKAIVEKPTMILCHTIPGKGVDFMEYDYSWHGKSPNKEEAGEALKQLQKKRKTLLSEYR